MTTSKLTRILSAILALLMMTSLFAACAETGAGDENGATTTADPAAAATTAAPVPEETALTDDVPEYDFKGEDIIILARNRDWVADEIYTEENVIDIEEAKRAVLRPVRIIRASAIGAGVLLILLGVILNFTLISDALNSLF